MEKAAFENTLTYYKDSIHQLKQSAFYTELAKNNFSSTEDCTIGTEKNAIIETVPRKRDLKEQGKHT